MIPAHQRSGPIESHFGNRSRRRPKFQNEDLMFLQTENQEPANQDPGEVRLAKFRVDELIVKSGALQQAILNSANFSVIATDEMGIVQLFNAGAELMLGYTAADVLDKITPADISDPLELSLRAAALSKDHSIRIAPGFEALVFKAARGIEDIYELTYIRKDK